MKFSWNSRKFLNDIENQRMTFRRTTILIDPRKFFPSFHIDRTMFRNISNKPALKKKRLDNLKRANLRRFVVLFDPGGGVTKHDGVELNRKCKHNPA